MAGSKTTMSWTAENDRILLLKLIETHAFHIDYAKIHAAWPKDAHVIPTPRAISERLVKIKKMAGVSGASPAGRKQVTPRARLAAPKSLSTPTSSARKRTAGGKKKKNDDSESEDADEHMTSEEEGTPCPTTKSRKVGAGRSPGGAALGLSAPAFGAAAGAGRQGHNEQYKIKVEDDDPFRNGDFERTLQRAEQMSAEYAVHLNSNNNSGNISSSMTNNGVTGRATSGMLPNASVDGGNDEYPFNPSWFSATNAVGVSGTTTLSSTSGRFNNSPNLARQTSQMRISGLGEVYDRPHSITSNNTSFVTAPESQPATPSFINPMATQRNAAVNTPFKPVPKLDPAPRVRPSRMASKQAKEGMSAHIKEMKERDEEDGLRSSVEDSDESAFQADDDDEYI